MSNNIKTLLLITTTHFSHTVTPEESIGLSELINLTVDRNGLKDYRKQGKSLRLCMISSVLIKMKR